MTTSTTKPATITPTPGRMVWFWPSYEDRSNPAFHIVNVHEPLAAVIAFVHGDDLVNLTVFDQAGWPHARQNVPLLQDSSVCPATLGFCEWMPYQRGQAAKTEAVEAALASVQAEPKEAEDDSSGGFINLGTPKVVAAPPSVVVSAQDRGDVSNLATKLESAIQGLRADPVRVICIDTDLNVTTEEVEALIGTEVHINVFESTVASEFGASPRWAKNLAAGEGNALDERLRCVDLCFLTLRNGHVVTGESICASKRTYDREKGEAYARADAISKVQALLAYGKRAKLASMASEESRHPRRVVGL